MKITNFEYHLQEIKERHVNQGYNKKSIDQQFQKVKTTDRNVSLKEKKHGKETEQNSTSINFMIDLMECTLCNKQCVGNADTAFNFRLNNH